MNILFSVVVEARSMTQRWQSRSIPGVVTMLTLAVAFTAMFAGFENWWVAFVVGFGFVLPAASMLAGNRSESSTSSADADETPTATTNDEETSKDDAMHEIRERYARGELSEQQFETKLERLLETETLEDARKGIEESRRNRADREPATREYEYE